VDSVYTPQVVVNGQAQALGSDGGAVQEAIRAVTQGPRANVQISGGAGDRVSFKVNGLPAGVKSADIVLAVTESSIASNVERGENRGKRLYHTSVVRSLTNLGRLDAKNGAYTAEARLNLQTGLGPAQCEAGAAGAGPLDAAHHRRGLAQAVALLL